MNPWGKAESGKRKAENGNSRIVLLLLLVPRPRSEASLGTMGFKAPMCVRNSEVPALHEPPHLVGADVRKPALSLSKGLILSQRVLREEDQSLVTSAPTLNWVGSWPRCASKKLEALHEPPHLVAADVRRLTLKSGKRKRANRPAFAL